jgi:hypothetical protein
MRKVIYCLCVERGEPADNRIYYWTLNRHSGHPKRKFRTFVLGESTPLSKLMGHGKQACSTSAAQIIFNCKEDSHYSAICDSVCAANRSEPRCDSVELRSERDTVYLPESKNGIRSNGRSILQDDVVYSIDWVSLSVPTPAQAGFLLMFITEPFPVAYNH